MPYIEAEYQDHDFLFDGVTYDVTASGFHYSVYPAERGARDEYGAPIEPDIPETIELDDIDSYDIRKYSESGEFFQSISLVTELGKRIARKFYIERHECIEEFIIEQLARYQQ